MKKNTRLLGAAAAALCGIVSFFAAGTFLTVGLIRGSLNVLQIIFLSLILCGAVALGLSGLFLFLPDRRPTVASDAAAEKQRGQSPSRLKSQQAQKEALPRRILSAVKKFCGTSGSRLKSRLPQRNELPQKMLSIVILMISCVFFLYFYAIALDVDPAPKSTALENLSYETAEVLEITEEYYQGDQQMEDRPVGRQEVTLKVTSGKLKGQIFQSVRNNLALYSGTVLEVGDSVIVAVSADSETVEIDSNYIYEYNRTTPLLIVVLFFLVITILVGGKIGAKSLLGLGLTILCIFAILYPLLIGGWPTLPCVLVLCAYVTVVEFVVLGGVNKKTICAMLGTIAGVAIAMLFALLSTKILRLSGYQIKDAVGEIEALGQLRQTQPIGSALQLNYLLVGGILIATLGAVNDVAMSISSAMNELVAVNPNLTRRELFKSGMNIGRDMVGTMTNTLILAFVGGSFVEILYYSSLDLSFYELMSTTYLPVEMVQAIASSAGVILAVPISVLLGMIFYAHPHAAKKAK